MPHKICKISNFKIVPPYTLELYFDDSVIKVVDLEPILYGELYGRLRNIEFFKTVFLDSEVHRSPDRTVQILIRQFYITGKKIFPRSLNGYHTGGTLQVKKSPYITLGKR